MGEPCAGPESKGQAFRGPGAHLFSAGFTPTDREAMAVTVSASSFSHCWASTREEATEDDSRCSEGQYRPARGKRVRGPAGPALCLPGRRAREAGCLVQRGAPPTPARWPWSLMAGAAWGPRRGPPAGLSLYASLRAAASHWGPERGQVRGQLQGQAPTPCGGRRHTPGFHPWLGGLNDLAIPGTSDTLRFVTRTGGCQLARDQVCWPSHLCQPHGPAA